MGKGKQYVVIALAALAIIGGFIVMGVRLSRARGEIERLKDNQSVLLTASSDTMRSKSGKEAMSVTTINLKTDELPKDKELSAAIKDLGVRLNRVLQAQEAATSTEVRASAAIRDSIVYVDPSAHRVQRFDWHDPWVSVTGQIKGREVDVDYKSADTLTTVLHRVPKRFLFFRYGTKEVRMTVRSSNPHTHLTYSKSVTLER